MKAVKLVDMSYKKDEVLNNEIEQMYLGLKSHLEAKYKDLVYMNLLIDEQQKLQEQAEIVEQPSSGSSKPPPAADIVKTKNHYIMDKETTVEIAYRLYK